MMTVIITVCTLTLNNFSHYSDMDRYSKGTLAQLKIMARNLGKGIGNIGEGKIRRMGLWNFKKISHAFSGKLIQGNGNLILREEDLWSKS